MESLRLNDLERQMADDLRWAAQAAEVRRYAGMLVAVHKKRVVGLGSDRDALIAQAAEQENCAWHEIVVFVTPSAALSEIPR